MPHEFACVYCLFYNDASIVFDRAVAARGNISRFNHTWSLAHESSVQTYLSLNRAAKNDHGYFRCDAVCIYVCIGDGYFKRT